MLKTIHVALLVSVVAACGGSRAEELFDDQGLATTAASGPSKKWTGTQTCMGSGGDGQRIDTTSAESTLEAFDKTKTQVSITGVDVGPNPEYSCTELTFAAVVTDADKSHVSFETASDDAMRQPHCSSQTGRGLVVGWLRGYDSDLSQLDGPWNLHFSARVEDPGPDLGPDPSGAKFRSSLLDIQCEFDFTLE